MDRLVRRVFFVAVAAEILWLILDGVINYAHAIDHSSVRKIFNIAREESLPTWFASLQALAVGVTAFLISRRAKLDGESKWTVRGWITLACFFVYMSMDDAAVIHERLGTAFGDLAQEGSEETFMDPILTWFESYHWQVFLGPIFASFGVFIVIFLWKQMGRFGLRRYFLIALTCWVTAVVIDYIEGIEEIYEIWAYNLGVEEYDVSHWMKATEETLEMFGMTLFLTGFLACLARMTAGMTIRIEGRSA